MKPEVLQITNVPSWVEAELERNYTVHKLASATDRQALLAEVGPRIRGAATVGKADAGLIDALPALEIISSFGVGYDGVDVAHARPRGVTVTNTPDVLNDDVANLAVLLVLNATRRFTQNERYLRAGRWPSEGDPPLAQAVRGKRVGILGLGRIGKDIARKLEVFGCEIAYHGRSRQDDQSYTFHDKLTDMARACDILIAICPGGEATRGIINAEVLDALGPDGLFVNVARGSVHDEEALIAALKEGRLGGAALDVFAAEPHVPDDLMALDNVVLQPHQGSATVQTRKAMWDLVLENLALHFAGKPVKSPV